jgi:uncharacterized protein
MNTNPPESDLPSLTSGTSSMDQKAGKRFGRRIWQIVRAALIFYLLVVLALMFLERWMVYPAPPVGRGDWQPAGLAHEDVRFQSADGTKLHGWFVPNARAKRAILYFHGNAEQVGDLVDLVAHLRDTLDAAVFVFDYRGYGQSDGRPNEAGCIADGRAAQTWLANKLGTPANQIVLMGRSLGGGVAVAIAAETGAQALVLENTFPSVVDVAARHFPWLPVRWLMKNRYDSVARIGQFTGPLFQIHGELDDLIPPQFGRRLFDAAPSAIKHFVGIPNRGHNDPWPAGYYRDLAAFLDQVAADATTAAAVKP